jgi:RNA polymerase sigma-70 factor (ECF subfamily)
VSQIATKDIEEKIESLSDEYKDPFVLHFKGFKYKEIAERLEIPIGTVKSRIFIARKKLIDLLPDYSYTLN